MKNRGAIALELPLRRAIATLEAALSSDSFEVALACQELGNVLLAHGQIAEASEIHERASIIRRALPGDRSQ